MHKIRKQLYLEPWQQERLSRLAKESGISEAEIIRNALDAYLLALDRLPSDHPLSELAGMGSSETGEPGSVRHDEILYRSP